MKRWHILIIACSFFLAGYLIADYPKDFRMPLCSYSPDDEVIPVVNDNYFNITYDAISNSKQSVDIILYEFKWYDSNNYVVQLRNALISAAERNVSVRMIIDQAEYRDVETSLSKENKRTGNFLKSNGINVKYDSLKQTTHNKLIIVDNEIVIIGSHNWGYSALTRNNEASVRINDLKVSQYYEDYFENLWISY